MPDKLLVVDGHNLLVRAVFAMGYRPGQEPLQTTDGVVTGALISFINMLSQHVRDIDPTYLVVCFDGGKSEYRTKIDPEYKANRKPGSYGEESGPDSPFTLVKQFLTLAGINWIQRKQVEADDLIAAYTLLGQEMGCKVYILSNDKDFFQLIRENVHQRRIGVPGEVELTPHDVYQRLGVWPEDVAKHMALTGDAGDNVAGVPGIGPKTATKFLDKHYHDLVKVIEHEPKVNPWAERVGHNQMLVDLTYPTPEEVGTQRIQTPSSFKPTNIASPLWGELLAFLDRYEMRVISHRLQSNELWKDPWRPGLTCS